MRKAVSAMSFAALLTMACRLAAGAAPLTGPMATLDRFVGTVWSCTTNVPAMGSMPAHTDRTQVNFESVAGNVLHVRIVSPTFVGDQYFGYNTSDSRYWMASVNNMGETSFGTSADGRVFTGMTGGAHPSVSFTTTFSGSGNQMLVHEAAGAGTSAISMDTTCAR